MGSIPEVALSGGGRAMPMIGLGTASYPPPAPGVFRGAVLEAIALGYRHFDTASLYNTERALGEAIAEALRLGLVQSRAEFFITSKLWCTDAHADRVLPALRESLGNLQLEYLDLYLVHWPITLKPKEVKFPFDLKGGLPMDMNLVWGAMEECHRLGLAKSIGVSNFSCKKLDQVLTIAKIPPSVNQVEMHPVWQQKKLIDFCKEKGIRVTAYSPLGASGTPWGSNKVMDCDALKEVAAARGKTIAQVSLRWIYQQGAGVIMKSFKSERLKENKDIFDWELSKEDLHKISQIPQSRINAGEPFISADGPFKSLQELWDGEI